MVKCARVLVLTAVVAAWQVSPAIAGPLWQSASRLAEQAGRQAPGPTPGAARAATSASAEQGTLYQSSMSKRKKWLVVAVAVLGVAGGVYAIDHSVLDNTPSSKGTRKD